MTLKKILSILAAIAVISCIFTGCASMAPMDKDAMFDSVTNESTAEGGWYDAGMEWVEEDFAIEEAPAMDMVVTGSKNPHTSGNADADALPESERKIIKNKSMDVQTTDIKAFITEMKAQVSLLNGYIESSSNYKSSADFVIRMPAENYDAFSTVVGDLGTITFENEYIDDVTSQYIDVEARLTALRAEQESYLRLMERAETVDEILQIQSYLSNVNYQIESYTAQLNSMKSKISYSTIRVNIIEVERVKPVTEKPTVFERISENLSDNLYDIGEGAKDLFVDFISALPYIAIWAVIILVAVIILKVIIKKRKAKRAKATAAKIEKAPETENN